jgi:Arylsulfotransferase (ASST)
VLNDPVFTSGGSFSGQHDARVLRDGTLTLFDNGSKKNRPPRGVRYRLDLSLRTATLLESVTDVPGSICCGSTRRLPGGNWVTGWGGTAHVTEQEPDGTRVFHLDLGPNFVYRGTPIPFGRLSPAALRAGMEAQYAD